jgi:hypothetical protein
VLLSQTWVFTAQSFGYCLIVLSSFFTFEVGRKMDPNAHEILGTYLVHYKKSKNKPTHHGAFKHEYYRSSIT